MLTWQYNVLSNKTIFTHVKIIFIKIQTLTLSALKSTLIIVNGGLLGYDSMWSGRWLPMFQMKILSLSLRWDKLRMEEKWSSEIILTTYKTIKCQLRRPQLTFSLCENLEYQIHLFSLFFYTNSYHR